MHTLKCTSCGHTDVSIGHYNHDLIDNPDEEMLVFEKPPEIKLSNAPKIVFAMPIGTKQHILRYTCAKEDGGCGGEWADVPAYKTPNLIPVQMLMNYHQLQMPLNVTTTLITKSGMLSSEARQLMTKQAIRLGAKYIVYWDDDILVPAEGVYRLYNFMEKNPKVGIVTGVCTTRHDEFVEPVIYKAHGDGASWDFECGDGAIPEPIFAAGAGFMMARVEAIQASIEKLKAENGGNEVPIWADEKAFKVENDRPGVQRLNQFWGHDVRFCRVIQEAGYHVFVHGNVLCGHLDVRTGKIYMLPDDAPGFQKVRDRIASKTQGQGQSPQSDGGVPQGNAPVEQRVESH